MNKKHQVKPFIDIKSKNTIEKISHITGISIRNIGEDFCLHSITSDSILHEISQYFKRDFKIKNNLYVGRKSPKTIELSANKTRISILLSKEIYESIYSLSYVIGCSVSKVATLCIEKSLQDLDFIHGYILKYIELNKTEAEELQDILNDINESYNEKYSIPYLISYIVDEIKEPTQTTTEAIRSFIVNH